MVWLFLLIIILVTIWKKLCVHWDNVLTTKQWIIQYHTSEEKIFLFSKWRTRRLYFKFLYSLRNTLSGWIGERIINIHSQFILSNASFFFTSYWSKIALQGCVSFCCITKWISYTYTYMPIFPSSCISLPPSLSHPSRWSQSTELISLCYVAASHYPSILHLVVYIYICPCHSLTSSQLTLPPPCVLKSILYICVFIPVLPLGSSEPFFFF